MPPRTAITSSPSFTLCAMSALTYACRLETEPGVTVPIERCTPEDLAHARALEARREGLLVEIRHLIEDAYQWDLQIPQGLREQLASWTGGVPGLERLRDELRDALFV